jgi:hypothetical protein
VNRAITLGMTKSPFPASFDGSSSLFAFVLFAMLVASALALSLAIVQVRQLWADRRFGYDPSWAINSLVLAVCCGLLMRCIPDATYMIAFGDAEPATIQRILTVKRVMDFSFLAPVLFWMALFTMWRADISLKLRSPSNVVFSDYRYARLKRFIGLVGLTFGLAVAVTLGRLYH